MDSGRDLLQNMQNPPQVSTPVLGAVYLKDCPQQHYIPIYLLVLGAFALVLGVLSCLPCTREPVDGGQSTLSTLCNVWNSMVSFFLFCWFIAGNVWIYSIYPANYNQTQPHTAYCNKTLYLFAFWITTVVYMLFALCCCALICMCLCRKAGPNMGYSRDA
ncbi:transmembrane protein 272-like isoform X2 [Anguilla anguilla]|uniref:transmembrane protein 272-like isoform X2 n=1 Tax=Anguilla anguilla TaxID=7936 RepID=UPI0015A80E06|nr:transmembrane protein 272-like isoform X2 [Anguilla anguilla]